MSDTNKILLTVDDIFRMQGRQPGFDPSDLEYEQANKTADDMNRDLLKARMAPPPAAVTGGSFTNAEGRVTDYIVKPKGVDVQLLEPKVLTTPGGTFTMKSPTNAVPVLLPDGSTAQNYTGDPTMGGAPAPGIGGAGMAVTNAPTAAPSPTPAATPAPSFVVEATADEIRQRFPQAPANLVPGMTIRLNSGGVIVVK
jgi:hypothetical protein